MPVQKLVALPKVVDCDAEERRGRLFDGADLGVVGHDHRGGGGEAVARVGRRAEGGTLAERLERTKSLSVYICKRLDVELTMWPLPTCRSSSSQSSSQQQLTSHIPMARSQVQNRPDMKSEQGETKITFTFLHNLLRLKINK